MGEGGSHQRRAGRGLQPLGLELGRSQPFYKREALACGELGVESEIFPAFSAHLLSSGVLASVAQVERLDVLRGLVCHRAVLRPPPTRATGRHSPAQLVAPVERASSERGC